MSLLKNDPENFDQGGDHCTEPQSNPSQSSSSDDPDWDELGDSEVNREKIRCFISARECFQSAEESLSQSLDDIHEGFKTEVEAIIQVAVEIFNEQDSTCLAQEDDIQYYLMQNYKRREALQESLEESAKQAQGLFANLLSRLAMKF